MEPTLHTLEEGVIYIVNKSFSDYYNNQFLEGEKLTYIGLNFVPYQGGYTVQFKERSLYLQEDANSDIINTFAQYFQVFDISGRIVHARAQTAIDQPRTIRWENLGYFLACLLFTIIGGWIVFFSDEKNTRMIIMGWLGLIFFGLGTLVFLRSMLPPKNK